MVNAYEVAIIYFCLEGFLFGKIFIPCALACTLAKEVQLELFLGLGIYSGIFAIYLQCPSKQSRTAIIVFYVLCLLYVLSMASIASDTIGGILQVQNVVSNNSICKIIIFQICIGALSPQNQNDPPSIFRTSIVQVITNGSCDFIAQCILVCVNHRTSHPFYSPKSSKKRSSVVGSCGVKISVLL
jgi:hypothetical protein